MLQRRSCLLAAVTLASAPALGSDPALQAAMRAGIARKVCGESLTNGGPPR